jgi:hypothetical protein
MQPLAVVGGAAAMAALTGGGLTGSGFATAVVIILATGPGRQKLDGRLR